MLDKLEKAYAQGDKAALWQALIHCARWKEPLPRWVSDALEIANLKNLLGDLGSFNNVFGRPNTKGKAEQLKRDHYYALEIAHLADRAESKGEPRNEEWFTETGRAIPGAVLGKSKVKQLLNYARFVLLRRAGR